ncbi:MAG: hydroxymethylbilane synthase [Gammaproteobacteria bacterium]|nr:hydroxymethylbilane synthase [Gammaproteobacteria bacterium]
MRQLTIATRNSPLALWQAHYVAAALKETCPQYDIKLLPIVTSGDRASKENWAQHTGKGLFVKELEEALLEGRADLAVHSMKDLLAVFPEGLCLAAICERGNPFDALISPIASTIDELPQGANIGTASLRRQAQLRAYRPDLQLHPLRGNVQTRLTKLHAHEFDGIILAAAGLIRLGLEDMISTELTPPLMLPACGQGAVGIECRQSDHELLNILSKIHCPKTAACVNTERRVNALLGGHCHVPIAIFCTIPTPNTLQLNARVLSPDGSQCIEAEHKGSIEHAADLADACAAELLKKGAKALLEMPACPAP